MPNSEEPYDLSRLDCPNCGYRNLIYLNMTSSQLAALLGSRTSKAKKKSSAINGKLGGRPKKA